MFKTLKTVAAGLLMTGLCAGCTALTSVSDDGDGVVYHLPKSVLVITVRQYRDSDGGRIFYTLGGPGKKHESLSGGKTRVIFDEYDIHSESVPDPQHKYVIQYRPSAFSDDRLCISRKPNGLLFDVQFAGDDRTPEIAFNVARFVGGFLGSPRPNQSSQVAFNRKTLAGSPKVLVRSYTGRVDPLDPDDVNAFNGALSRVFGNDVFIDVSRMEALMGRSAQYQPKGCNRKQGCNPVTLASRCDRNHICYRTELELPIDLMLRHKQRGGGKEAYLNGGSGWGAKVAYRNRRSRDCRTAFRRSCGQAIDVKYAKVVNANDVGTISVRRAFLVQKITKLRFQNGALLSAIVRKPSEVEEVSLLPLNVMNAILSVPSGLWQAAVSDTAFQQQALADLASQTEKINSLNTSINSLQLQGAEPVPVGNENYHLNCIAPKRGTNFLNILGPSAG